MPDLIDQYEPAIDDVTDRQFPTQPQADVSFLLPELFSEIFLFLALPYLHDVSESPGGHVPYHYSDINWALSWVAVSHVCRRWRAIALDTPALWSIILLDRRFPWATFFERARQTPVSVSSYLPYAPEGWRLTLREHISHTRAITLSAFHPASLAGFAFPERGSPLEEFHLYLLNPQNQDFKDVMQESAVTFLHADFGTEYDGLRPRCSIGSNLRSLTFFGTVLPIAASPLQISSQDIYESLRAMPFLEALSLENSLGPSCPTADEVVLLPNLTRVSIAGPGGVVSAFYGSIQPHALAVITLELNPDVHGSMTLVHVQEIASTLRGHLTRRNTPESADVLKLAQHCWVGYERVVLKLRPVARDDASERHGKIVISCSYLSPEGTSSIGTEIIRHLTRALHKDTVHSLRLHISSIPHIPNTLNILQDVFAQMSSVDHLLLCADSDRFLLLLEQTHTHDDITALFFPMLNRVELNNLCNLYKYNVPQILLNRRALGNDALLDVRVYRCTTHEEHIAALLALVNVKWDGETVG